MLSKDMIQTKDFSAKQLIREIVITNSKTVRPFPHKHNKLHTTFLLILSSM